MKVVHRNLVDITISSLIFKFGSGLIGVFLPLILINEGLEIWQVCLFYAAYGTFKITVNYPIFRTINKYGARYGLVFGYTASAMYMFALSAFISSGTWWMLYIAAMMMAVMNSFLWNSTHLHISQAMDSSRKSRDLAVIANLSRIVGIISPIAGGLLAVMLGTSWLTAIAATVALMSLIPIIRIGQIGEKQGLAKELRYSMKYAPKRDLIANSGFNAHTLVGVMVWPIYFAIFIPSFTQIGYIDAISTAVAVIILHVTAKRSDSGKSYRVLTEGTAMSSIVHIGRMFANSNPVVITVISSFYDVALSYQQNPWTSIYYAHAKKYGIAYILSMEIAGDLTYVLMWGLLGAVAYATQSSAFFFVAFNLAAITAWLSLLVTKDKQNVAT